jgi:hypothetical protein
MHHPTHHPTNHPTKKMNCPHCLREILDAVVRSEAARLAGKSTSEAKTLAARLNASRPRPGAIGKKKPRKIKINIPAASLINAGNSGKSLTTLIK